MVSSLFGKVMWLGRATIFLVGLAVILALVLGVASRALGADGKPFLLGTINKATKVSTLIKGGVGPALDLRVSSSNDPPLRVNSTAKVDNLNVDLLDGKDVSAFASSDTIMPKVLANDGEGSSLDADKLDGKEPSELPGTIVSVATFTGLVSSIPGSSSSYVFAGPTATVTTTDTQRLVGSAEAPLALSSGGPQSFNYDLCYQPSGGGMITNFAGGGYSIGELTTNRISWAAAGSVVPGAGTWKVGFCVLNNGGASAINDTDYVNGWVQIINQ